MSAAKESKSSKYQIVFDKANNFYSQGSPRNTCAAFIVDNIQVGLIRSDFKNELQNYPQVFIHQPAKGFEPEKFILNPSLNSPEVRTEAVEEVLQELKKKDVFVTLRGWRDEKYDVRKCFHDKSLMMLERAATPIFGTINYGVHLNGYFYNSEGQMMMWIGQRSATKSTFPNKLDNLCAGGLATGISVTDNMLKECQEEGSISSDVLSNMVSVGTISYCYEDERGIMPECQFIYDLELPSEFKPVNADGEVGKFHLYNIQEVKELILTDEFKPNCALVILDFLIRHGLITPEEEPYYPYIIKELHKPLPQLMK